jgi:AcrR family transcriptional regulator
MHGHRHPRDDATAPADLPKRAVNSVTGGWPTVQLCAMQNLVDPADDPTVDDGHRRGRILRALATCMAEKGYRATTVADIARVARVSKTVLYAHFRDKEDCLLELVSRATDKVLDELRRTQQEGAAAGLPWRDRLHGTVSALLSALASGPEIAWAVLVEVQAAGRSGLALRRDVLDRYVTLLCETADDLVARFPDEVRPVGAELVLAAVGGIHELMLARVERGQAARLTEDADVAAAVLVGLLERRG